MQRCIEVHRRTGMKVASHIEYILEKLFLAVSEIFPDKSDSMNLWGMLDKVYRERHTDLINLDKNICTLALVEEIITDMVSVKYPMMKAKKFKQMIGAKYDMVGYMFIEDGKRVIDFNGSDSFIGKNRFANIIPSRITEDDELFSLGKIIEKIKQNNKG